MGNALPELGESELKSPDLSLASESIGTNESQPERDNRSIKMECRLTR